MIFFFFLRITDPRCLLFMIVQKEHEHKEATDLRSVKFPDT